ncbi:MAG: isovaleryl-CoA dehydrogenase [Stagnimonas sp.]|nr:isovaleryl-CoA dehydrogenase [Stagnimonas sp.]
MTVADRFLTHTVDNQVPPLRGLNLYASDLALREAIAREGGGWGEADLQAYGAIAGGELMDLGFQANENKPKLKLFDRYGHRLDEVEFHPAYHRIMALGLKHGVAGYAWRHAGKPGAHVARAGLAYLHNQADQGTSCPLTMTYACVAALQHEPALAKDWVPRVAGGDYDPVVRSALQKSTLTVGMGMTEKQGGSDVRTNSTKAFVQPDGSYEIVGHKWFFSAPMCDAWLVLAYTDTGITCFLAPKMRPDGVRNAIRIQRLKDKLGDWSNASSEVEFQGAWAQRVGPEGRGIATILEMVALTRLDCMIGSASLMRQALVQALHHAQHRSAFGKKLIDQPLMRNVLADLALESEAAVALTMRVARAVDASERDPHEAAIARLATALGKYWICKRTPGFVNEAQECLGGAGYVEESNLPRLYRQAPLNSIWEGSGNIQCLDVLRALSREPETRQAYFTELAAQRGSHPDFDRELAWLAGAFDDSASLELRARHLVERMALALQAAVLLRAGPPELAASFCASRLGGQQGLAYGTLPAGSPFEQLLGRALPPA